MEYQGLFFTFHDKTNFKIAEFAIFSDFSRPTLIVSMQRDTNDLEQLDKGISNKTKSAPRAFLWTKFRPAVHFFLYFVPQTSNKLDFHQNAFYTHYDNLDSDRVCQKIMHKSFKIWFCLFTCRCKVFSYLEYTYFYES